MHVGLLVLRVLVGLLFAGHGAQKLFGWFGGYGVKGTGGFFESLGFRPGPLMAVVAGTSELGGGLLLAAGLATPLAAAAIIGVMINAVLTAKRHAGLYNGFEIDVLYATVAAAVAFTGAGAYSLDRVFGWTINGWRYGVGAIALAVVTGALTLATRRPAPQAAEVPEAQAA
jgi:putative oxidoreductase